MDQHIALALPPFAGDAIQARLAAAPPGRLTEAVGRIVAHAISVIEELDPAADELDALLNFLTEVGYATDARRQEWVLLADVFGLSDMVMHRTGPSRSGATPTAMPGPFYRPDAPLLPDGANLCRVGGGVALSVQGRIEGVDGQPLAGALVEVWHANPHGLYENQDPDNQPEYNLRGRLVADAQGQFAFQTVRPGGYALPADGPVGQLAHRLGLPLDRPAHLHFAVTAPGHRRLVTAIFDASDPAIGRDALFAVRPGLLGDFLPKGAGFALTTRLVLDRDDSAHPPHTPLKG